MAEASRREAWERQDGETGRAFAAFQMKERPILFSGPMVKAILDGHKTQTRRVIKPQPDLSLLKPHTSVEFRKNLILGPIHHPREWGLYSLYSARDSVPIYAYDSPYGQPGDRLWVRETWADMICVSSTEKGKGKGEPAPKYKATADPTELEILQHAWKPSIYMPRWASRITLEIVSIRPERLHEISEEDVFAEGIRGLSVVDPEKYPFKLQGAFAQLWDSINGKTYTWDLNPWVWRIEFRRVP